MAAPIVKKKIPSQVINEGAAYGPFKLRDFIDTPDKSPCRFSAALSNGTALPKGLICTEDGNLTGIPAKGTTGSYEIKVDVENEEGEVSATFIVTIKPAPTEITAGYIDQVKSQIWEALEQNLPIPDLGAMLEREITPLDIYYLLERWGTLTIWDAFNLDPPGEKKLLRLEGVSPHYNVYDRGSCLISGPKDLYSHERTVEDGLQTARAMAREVYKRDWTVELVGFDKLRRAAWIEFQLMADQYGKRLEVVNFSPSVEDIKLYTDQAVDNNLRGKLE